MREINRIKRKAARWAVVASLGAAASVGTVVGNETARGGDFWPRLGTSATETNGRAGNAGFADVAQEGSGGEGGASRVKSADFTDFGENADFVERKSATTGKTRLVGWTASDGATAETSETAESTETKTPILRGETTAKPTGGSFFGALVSTVGSLALVLGAFFALVALWKRTAPKTGGVGVAETLDSTPLGDRARLLTIRWGNRLILAARTPEKITPLAEITEPGEAAEMLAAIERRKNAASSGFSGRGALDFLSAFGAKGRKR